MTEQEGHMAKPLKAATPEQEDKAGKPDPAPDVVGIASERVRRLNQDTTNAGKMALLGIRDTTDECMRALEQSSDLIEDLITQQAENITSIIAFQRVIQDGLQSLHKQIVHGKRPLSPTVTALPKNSA